uniref:Uncharacterized protein n=1 Tax=Anguilla anguilla TaxID=7936 RepID=A0A0E9TNH4_ANGAN
MSVFVSSSNFPHKITSSSVHQMATFSFTTVCEESESSEIPD